jgi:site-specific recombinase XerC
VLDCVVEGSPRHRWAIHPERPRGRAGSAAVSGGTTARTAKPLTRRPASQRFHRYAREAGLPLGVTPHGVRATSITEALDRKCPIEAVQASVGHRPIATTKMYDPRKLHDRESASFAVQY